ncbi:MAG: hypothetical protein LBG16_02250 [Elusimicrobiota bacterium]|nr:hypothetical protein [Elusimicrobiota bacterium]
MDISLPKEAEVSGANYIYDNVRCWIFNSPPPQSIYCTPLINKKSIGVSFENYFQRSIGTHQGRVYCWANAANEAYNKVCMEMSSKTAPDFVQETSNGIFFLGIDLLQAINYYSFAPQGAGIGEEIFLL